MLGEWSQTPQITFSFSAGLGREHKYDNSMCFLDVRNIDSMVESRMFYNLQRTVVLRIVFEWVILSESHAGNSFVTPMFSVVNMGLRTVYGW